MKRAEVIIVRSAGSITKMLAASCGRIEGRRSGQPYDMERNRSIMVTMAQMIAASTSRSILISP